MMIDMAADFSPYPSGRIPSDGSFSGESFREKLLRPAIRDVVAGGLNVEDIVVNIDGVRTFGSSFLDEAFGGLVRSATAEEKRAVVEHLKIECTKPHLEIYRDAIRSHLSSN